MLNLTLIIGLWATTCVSTQINGKSGFTIESYEFRNDQSFEFTRNWFKDEACTDLIDSDIESGKFNAGKKLSGMFVSGNTYELDFDSNSSKDLGAIRIESKEIKIARGQKGSTLRNTMVGFIGFFKN